MSKLGTSIRLWVVVVFLLGSTAALHGMSHGEAMVTRESLSALPMTFGGWQGREAPLEERIVQAVGVTDYTNRLYLQAAQPPISLYVGYYASQRTGDTIHSPKNCLPGAGWDPIRSDYAFIPVGNGRTIKVNEYVIQQGLDQQLVFYWYQGRGRVIASEYWGKFYMILDAITHNRTDGALVRLITPLRQRNNITPARARLVGFAQKIFPDLDKFIPN